MKAKQEIIDRMQTIVDDMYFIEYENGSTRIVYTGNMDYEELRDEFFDLYNELRVILGLPRTKTRW
jgi:hypothetical protein